MFRFHVHPKSPKSPHTMQDLMRLGAEGRMNRPGRAEGNWAWRVGEPSVWKSLSKEAASLKSMAEVRPFCQGAW